MPATLYQPSASQSFRNGQWVKFDLNEKVQLCIVQDGNKVLLADAEDDGEVERLKNLMKPAGDGRFVGIFVAAGRAPDGQGGYVFMPACVAPQRAVLGPDGSQNLTTLYGSMAVTVLLPADSLRHVEATLDRGDLPKHRDATSHKDWNPRR